MHALTQKQKMLNALNTLAEDSTIEEGIECLRVLYKVEKGLAQLDAGDFVTTDEIKRRFGL